MVGVEDPTVFREVGSCAGPPTASHPVNLGRYPASGVYEGLLDDVLGRTMLADLVSTEQGMTAVLGGRRPAALPLGTRCS